MLNNKILSLFLFALAIMGCRKDIDTIKVEPEEIIFPSQNISGSLMGEVMDINGNYIKGATITIGNQALITNEDGFFYFQDITMNAKGTYVTIKKEGYFLGARMLNTLADKVAYTRVELLKKNLIQVVPSDASHEINIDNQAKIKLPANGFVDENGNSYSGNVSVYGAWMNPTAAETALRMPGDLRAVDSGGEFKQLATFGMIAVELEGSSGQKLQIADGQTAIINMTVPASILSKAPSAIPLWHFDEENGYWIEEGEAQLNGNEYVGEVKHFSFWNCDDPFNLVNLTGTLVDSNGNPIPNTLVYIEIVSSGLTGCGFSDSEGVFGGLVPKDQLLIIRISLSCGGVFEQEIGPFSEDVVLDPIIISSPEYTYTIQAKLVDCENEPLVGAYMKINHDGANYYPVSMEFGAINLSFLSCDDLSEEGTYIAYDLENLKQTSEENFLFDTDNYAALGTIQICDELAEFIQYTLNGDLFTIIDLVIYTYAGGTKVALYGNFFIANNDNANIELAFPATAAGTYGLDTLSVSGRLPTGEQYHGSCGSDVGCMTGSHSGASGTLGEIVTGDFSGVIDDTLNINGAFKVMFE